MRGAGMVWHDERVTEEGVQEGGIQGLGRPLTGTSRALILTSGGGGACAQAVDAGRSMQGRGRWCRRGMGMGLSGVLHVPSCLCFW